MTEHIRTQMNDIPIPPTLHNRCEQGIQEAVNEKKGHITMLSFPKKTIAAVAALVLTVGLLAGSNTALAKDFRGYFSDVFRMDGAVVGTEYHNASEEITVTTAADGEAVIVNVQFLYPEEAPYAFISEISLRNVTLTDSSGNKLLTVEETDLAAAASGEAAVTIPLGTVTLSSDTEYTLSFDTVVGHAKAEQPLPMSGTWSCSFKFS